MSRAGRTRRFTREAVLGTGRDLLERAGVDLINWEMHRRAGLLVVADGPATVGRRARLQPCAGPGAWLRISAPCEVTAVIDRRDARGFTYRALPGHPEHGWETFLVERDPATDTVRMRIDAESANATLLARLGAPVARAEQSRLTRRYLTALREDL